MSDVLSAEKIFAAHGRKRVIGCRGEVLPVVDSTMHVARRRAEGGSPDGYVVVAEEQTAGRGRKGKWECPPGLGLLMSVVLRLGLPLQERRVFTILGAVAAAEAVQRFGPPARIKWPNDVVVAVQEGDLVLKKLGGVLVEQVGRSDAVPAHILGIGINVNQKRRHLPGEAALPATSVLLERGGVRTDRNALCRTLLERLDFWYERLYHGQTERLLARWRSLNCLPGRRVTISMGGRTFPAEVLGVRSTGELIVRDATGQRLHLTEEKARLVFGTSPGV